MAWKKIYQLTAHTTVADTDVIAISLTWSWDAKKETIANLSTKFRWDIVAWDMPSSIDAANIADGSVSNTEFQYLNWVTSAIQTQIDTKAPIADPTFTWEIGIGSVNVSESELGILEGATLTTTELNYVDWVTSAIQTQLDAKGVGDLVSTNNLSDIANAATARTNLWVDAAGTDNSTDVTLGWTGTYISIAGQVITVDPITESDISDLWSYITDITGSPLSELSDVTITTIASGEVLKWNGSAWINQTLAEAGISATGHTHTHADITDFDTELAGKTNTTAFTPSADYHVATKKYVDDNAGGAPEGTAVLSTGEVWGSKFLREDWDGTCSWQAIPWGWDLLAANNLSDLANAWTARTNLWVAIGTDVQGVLAEWAFANWDKTKLDGIETGADVTDTTNVTSAGAVMDSEVDANIKTLTLPASTTISTFWASLVDDITAAAARTTLDVDQAGTDNSTDVTLAGTPDYLSLSGQQITLAQIDLTTDVTGDLPFTNIAQIATNRILGRSTAGTGDVEALTGSSARDVLSLGTGDSPQFTGIELWHATDTTLARASAGDVNIEGNIIYRAWGTDVPVADGGTGASTASGARTNLWVAIGSDVQAYSANNLLTTTTLYPDERIDAGAMVATTTSGAASATEEYATNDIMSDHFLFDWASEENCQFRWKLPDNWDGSTVKVKFYWDAATGATASDWVTWGIKGRALSNDDAIDGTWGTEVEVDDTVIAVWDMHISAASGAVTIGNTPAAWDVVVFNVARKVGDVNDDMTEDAKLLWVAVQYWADLSYSQW